MAKSTVIAVATGPDRATVISDDPPPPSLADRVVYMRRALATPGTIGNVVDGLVAAVAYALCDCIPNRPPSRIKVTPASNPVVNAGVCCAGITAWCEPNTSSSPGCTPRTVEM